MDPINLAFNKLTEIIAYIAQFLDRPQVIFALLIIALLLALGLLRMRR